MEGKGLWQRCIVIFYDYDYDTGQSYNTYSWAQAIKAYFLYHCFN